MTTKRRWYQFSLRTMFVLTVVVSIPLAWVGYQLNWIRQRNDWRGSSGFACSPEPPGSDNPATAPGYLWLFGEEGLGTIWCLPEEREEVQRVFPEAYLKTRGSMPIKVMPHALGAH